MTTSILKGIKVLDLTRVLSGPHCCMLLGDLGAEVIKIEKPGTGDVTRANFPRYGGESTYFLAHNRNKKSITLNFRKEGAKEIFFEMVKDADIVVENFRAGTMEKMGCGYDKLKEINPGIILTRISGFGQSGPYADRACLDGVAQAMSGVMDNTGYPGQPPVMVGVYMADYAAALYAVIGTISALYARKNTGKGQVVDVALMDSAISFLHTAIPDFKLLNQEFTRNGNEDRYSWPANFYISKDNDQIYINAGLDNAFANLMKIIGKPEIAEDERYKYNEGRAKNRDFCDSLVREWVAQHSTEEVVAAVAEGGIPCAKVRGVREMVDDPQVNSRGMIREVDHSSAGKIYLSGPVIHLSENPLDIQLPPPLLGEHNEAVYKGMLGLSDEKYEELKKNKVI